jgi:hypothetical protein
MRVVVGSGSLRDVRPAELDRHLTMMSRFLERAESDAAQAEARSLTMILRSATSGPAQALISMKDDLFRAGVSAKVVLAKLEPEEELRALFASLSEFAPPSAAKDLLRWARNPRLLDAHEQVTYGASMCWSGDAMRRDADKRNTLSLFDEAAPQTARLGRLAFEALWEASALAPERRLLGPAKARPSGNFHALAGSPVAGSPLRPSLQGWPLVRH